MPLTPEVERALGRRMRSGIVLTFAAAACLVVMKFADVSRRSEASVLLLGVLVFGFVRVTVAALALQRARTR